MLTNTRPLAMRDALLGRICQSMADDEKIFFLSADFGSPVLDKMRSLYPERFINVGVAEQNLINLSAGLAVEGFTVFAYAIAPFITMRCYEQIRVCLALLSVVRPINVNLIGVGAGYSYVVSGPTHQCYEDLSVMRALPNMSVYSPADHITAEQLFDTCITEGGPKYLRLDAQVLSPLYADQKINMNTGFHVHQRGDTVLLIATGYMVHTALKVAEALKNKDIHVGVIDLFDITGFSEEALHQELSHYKGVVSMEEGFRGKGGMDAMLFDYIARHGLSLPLLNLGVRGSYRFELGTRAELHEQVGIGKEVVTRDILDFIKQR